MPTMSMMASRSPRTRAGSESFAFMLPPGMDVGQRG
jgi:hypothetical protein